MPFFGEMIALGTVLCWTCSVQFFAAASREAGAIPVKLTMRRVTCHGVVFGFLAMFGQEVKTALLHRKAVACTAVGAAIGPFVGVSLSLLTLHYLPTGVASTFFSLIPICIIPFSISLHKEHVSLRAMGGAVMAVFGVYLLMA